MDVLNIEKVIGIYHEGEMIVSKKSISNKIKEDMNERTREDK